MSDIYDALLGDGPVDNADLVARLRRQQNLGQLAALSGISPLQKMGGELQNDSQGQASALYQTREKMKDRATQRELQAAEASEREKDRMAIAAGHRDDLAASRGLQQTLLDQREQFAQDTLSEKTLSKAQGTMDKNQAAYDTNVQALNRLETSARKLLEHPGLDSITGLTGANTPDISDAARDAAAQLDTFKNQVVIGTMMELKNASKTGSTGFGQLSEKEGDRLENSKYPLARAQTYAQMRESLTNFIKYAQDAKKNMKNGLDREAQSLMGPVTSTTRTTRGPAARALPRATGAAPAASTAERPPLDSFGSP